MKQNNKKRKVTAKVRYYILYCVVLYYIIVGLRVVHIVLRYSYIIDTVVVYIYIYRNVEYILYIVNYYHTCLIARCSPSPFLSYFIYANLLFVWIIIVIGGGTIPFATTGSTVGRHSVRAQQLQLQLQLQQQRNNCVYLYNRKINSSRNGNS